MTLGAYLLVVLSAVTHAYWNFLLKRSGGSQALVALSKVVESALLAPVLLIGAVNEETSLKAFWYLPVVGALLVLLNYVLLSEAYKRGDLSFVYPVARGAILIFLPPLAYITIGERLNVLGGFSIVLIVLGIGTLQLRGFDRASLRRCGRELLAAAAPYALFAAFIAACYTVWDKQAVQVLTPLTYYAAYTVLLGFFYGAAMPKLSSRVDIRALWKREWRVIFQVGVLNSGSYLLALAALKAGQASYVIALRQLSIAVGAVLGARMLGEVLPAPRRVGLLLVVAGCALLGLTK